MLDNPDKKSKKLKPEVIFLVIAGCLVLGVMLLVVLTALTQKLVINKETLLLTLKGQYYWKLALVLFLGGGGYILVKVVLDNVGKKGKDFTEGEDSTFLSIQDIKRNKAFKIIKYSDIATATDSTVFEAKGIKKGKEVEVILLDEPCHTLAIGTTGSGKTTGYIDPIMQILMHTKTKPSFVVADVKGELFRKHSKELKKQGYKVNVLNLRDPYKSSKWNPFNSIIKKIQMIWELEKDNSTENKIKIQTLDDEITDDAREIIYAICPIDERSSDKYWNEGARDFILAVVYAFIEDIKNGDMDINKLNLFNLHYNISNYIQGENVNIIKKYLTKGRDKHSLVSPKASVVLSSQESEKTFASFMSNVAGYVSKFSDKGILSMTSSNDVEVQSFDESPNCLFIQVPDEKTSRHYLVTILLEQCYKELVDKANLNYINGLTDDMKLLKRVYFFIDEFANFPEFKDFGTVISVSRSRGIFFNLIIQNYEQLTMKYDKAADTIKNNCPMKVFLGSDSVKTMREFQDLGGYKKGANVSLSSQTGGGHSTSTSFREVPILPISELKVLNGKGSFGNALISCFGLPLRIAKFTPFFKLKNVYQISRDGISLKEKVSVFNSEELLYDIKDKYEIEEWKEEEAIKLKEEIEASFLETSTEITNQYKKNDRENTKKNEKIYKLIYSLNGLIADEDFESLMKSPIWKKINIIQALLKEIDDMEIRLKLKILKDYLEKSQELDGGIDNG